MIGVVTEMVSNKCIKLFKCRTKAF